MNKHSRVRRPDVDSVELRALAVEKDRIAQIAELLLDGLQPD